MKLIIAGSRNITDYELVKTQLDTLLDITEVVCGKARGVDALGERWAIENNIPVKYFPANWDKYGKSAGYRRNVEMAEYADGLFAIWDGESKGTNHMVNIAKEKHMPILIYNTKTKVLDQWLSLRINDNDSI